MCCTWYILLCTTTLLEYPLLVESYSDAPITYGKFPEGFGWGFATSAYQIEGGWNLDGKGISIWDWLTHTRPEDIAENATGDVACDSYHKWRDDIQLLVDAGASYYRFSIAWTRIIPEGRGPRNQLGIDYYNNLINGLLEKGIQPMVTLFHSDTPITLEEEGGWLNPVSADWFEEYAKVCFEEFGDRVKHWITFNEPWVTCMFGIYTYKPEIEQSKGTLVYQCGHNLIKAHVQVYQLYKNMFSSAQKGLVGITLNAGMAYPKTDSREDQAAADRDIEFSLGWFANVLAANGNYPQVMIDKIAEKSSQQGFEQSRLPSFTEEEILLNQGSVDFIGLNHYTSGLAAYQQSDLNAIDYFADRDVVNSVDPTWYQAQDVDWLYVFPPGIRDLLKWMKSRYDVPVYITECGFSDKAGNLDDLPRVYYLKHYLNHLMEAINEDGCDVKGFMAWSLMDNMEWVAGYTIKFGLHHVNFSDPERPRTAKASAKFYKQIIADNGFEPNDACPYM